MDICKRSRIFGPLFLNVMKQMIKKPLWLSVVLMKSVVLVVLFSAMGCQSSEIQPKNEIQPTPDNSSTYYIVNFAGEGIDIEAQSILCGNLVSEPENPDREGYRFVGWFTDDGTFENQWNFKTNIVTQDTTLYVKWDEIVSLVGTKWKLVGIVDVPMDTMQVLDLQYCRDSNQCYTIFFESDNTFTTYSSLNEFVGIYEADYKTYSFQVIRLGGTQAIDTGGGMYYTNPFDQKTIQSFYLKENELRLYFNNNGNFLLYELLQSPGLLSAFQ